MKKIEPKDIDDDLLNYYESTDELPTEWEQVAYFDEETDLAIVSVDGIYGAVNRNGETVIPLIYQSSASCFSKGLLAVKKNNKWGYVDKNHQVIIPFEFDNLYTHGFEFEAELIQNNLFKRIEASFSQGKVFVRKDDKMGIINFKNEIVFPFIYKEIQSYNEKYLCASYNTIKYGLVDYNNQIRLPFIYDSLRTILHEDYLCFGEKVDEEIDICNQNNATSFRFQGNKLLKFGIINPKGDVIIPAISYEEISRFYDGKAMCFDYKKNEYFCYNCKTNETIYAPNNLDEDDEENQLLKTLFIIDLIKE